MKYKKYEMPCSVTDGQHENPYENWDDLKDTMEEISESLHPMTLEILWDKETKSWKKKVVEETMTECQNCKEVNDVVVNTYYGDSRQGVAVAFDEWECPDCGAYHQTSRLDPDYDPTPE